MNASLPSTSQVRQWLSLFCLAVLPFGAQCADPLDSWVERSTGFPPFQLAGIAYGNGRFVAAGGDWQQVFMHSLTSTNGFDWSVHPCLPLNDNLEEDAIHFANGRFWSQVEDQTCSSSDGSAWQIANKNLGSYPVYGNGIYVSPYHTSTNGVDWVERVFNPAGSLAFGNGIFVYLMAEEFAGKAWSSILNSTDGLGWTYSAFSAEEYYGEPCFGNGRFLVLGARTNTTYFPEFMLVSTDGMNWDSHPVPAPLTNGYHLRACGDRFFAVNTSWNPTNVFWSSLDGLAWEQHDFGATISCNGLAYGADTYVAVTYDGRVFQSAPMTNSLPPTPPTLSVSTLPSITLTGTLLSRYRIEFTTDLRDTNSFQPLATIRLTNSPCVYVDTSATNRSQRFYRAVLVP